MQSFIQLLLLLIGDPTIKHWVILYFLAAKKWVFGRVDHTTDILNFHADEINHIMPGLSFKKFDHCLTI